MKNSIKKHLKCLPITIWSKPVESGELEHVLVPILTRYAGVKAEEALYFHYRTQVYTLQHNQSGVHIQQPSQCNLSSYRRKEDSAAERRLGDFSGQLSDSSFYEMPSELLY